MGSGGVNLRGGGAQSPAPSQPIEIAQAETTFDLWNSIINLPRNTRAVVEDAFTDPYNNADRTGMVTVETVDERRGNAVNRIDVRPVNDLVFPNGRTAALRDAMIAKERDDRVYAGAPLRAGYETIEDWSREIGYYGSEGHELWARAAEARTGGQISADWWMRFDPFGGSAGAGPNVEPQGFYPDTFSRIAMAHDTDWSLGRYFGAGPMAALRGAFGAADELGMVGLGPAGNPELFGDIDNYVNGSPDWLIEYYAN